MTDLYKTSGSSPPEEDPKKDTNPEEIPEESASHQEDPKENTSDENRHGAFIRPIPGEPRIRITEPEAKKLDERIAALGEEIHRADTDLVVNQRLSIGEDLHKLHTSNGFRHFKNPHGKNYTSWEKFLKDREPVYRLESTYLRIWEKIAAEGNNDQIKRLVEGGRTSPAALADIARYRPKDRTILSTAQALPEGLKGEERRAFLKAQGTKSTINPWLSYGRRLKKMLMDAETLPPTHDHWVDTIITTLNQIARKIEGLRSSDDEPGHVQGDGNRHEPPDGCYDAFSACDDLSDEDADKEGGED